MSVLGLGNFIRGGGGMAPGFSGNFEGANADEIANLTKAIEAGSITGQGTLNSQTASGAPLKVESLENTLKVLEYTQKDLALWLMMPKTPAFNTVEEYNQLVSYGSNRGAFTLEGELPEAEDSVYTRRSNLIKFSGTLRSVTHPMTLVSTMAGNIIARETENGTKWLLKQIDRSLAFGNSSILPADFDGLYALHRGVTQADLYPTIDSYFNNNNVVIDCRGTSLKEEHLELAANGIIDNFGEPTDFYGPPRVLSDFSKTFYGNRWISQNSDGQRQGVAGQKIQEFESQFGNIKMNWDRFIKRNASKTITSQPESNKSPNAPVIGTVTPVGVDASAKWAATDAGAYFYAASTINRFGESALTLLNVAAATVVTGGSVDLAFTIPASPEPAQGIRIYRSERNAANSGGQFHPLFDISTAERTAGYDGAAANVVRDRNRMMPKCEQAFMLQKSDEIMTFKQLAPLMKMDLALLGPAFRFMILLYGAPQLYAPRKMVRFINIGELV